MSTRKGTNSYGEAPPDGVLSATSSSFKAVAAGPHYSLALREDGSVQCFGRNNFGQAPPEGVLGPFVAICAQGCAFAYGVRADGSVECWGANPWAESAHPYDIDIIKGWNNG